MSTEGRKGSPTSSPTALCPPLPALKLRAPLMLCPGSRTHFQPLLCWTSVISLQHSVQGILLQVLALRPQCEPSLLVQPSDLPYCIEITCLHVTVSSSCAPEPPPGRAVSFPSHYCWHLAQSLLCKGEDSFDVHCS